VLKHGPDIACGENGRERPSGDAFQGEGLPILDFGLAILDFGLGRLRLAIANLKSKIIFSVTDWAPAPGRARSFPSPVGRSAGLRPRRGCRKLPGRLPARSPRGFGEHRRDGVWHADYLPGNGRCPPVSRPQRHRRPRVQRHSRCAAHPCARSTAAPPP